MAAVFVSSPGTVVAFQNVGALPLSLFLENWQGFPAMRAIVTHVGGTSTGNFQFLHTLQEYIYVYVFGERVGDLSISGLAFSAPCGQQGGMTGIEQVADYYNQYRISHYGGMLSVQIGLSGAANLRGFLVGMRTDLNDTNTQLGQFQLTLKTFSPEANR